MVAILVIGGVLAVVIRNPELSLFLLILSVPTFFGFLICRRFEASLKNWAAWKEFLRRPQVTLRQIAIAIAIIAVFLAVAIQVPDFWELLFSIVGLSVWLSPGILIYLLSKASARVRLTLEILSLIALLALSSWTWRDQFYFNQADRAARLSQECSEWADASIDPVLRDSLHREAEWFSRQAREFRREAYWRGLIKGSSYDANAPFTNESLTEELGILEVMEHHETFARQAMRDRRVPEEGDR